MDLEASRKQINEIDEQMVALFKKRMETVVEVARYKRENHLPVLDRSREKKVLTRVAEMAGDELGHYARELYSTMFDVSRSYQRTMLSDGSPLGEVIQRSMREDSFPRNAIVACQGTQGAYSQQAAERLFESPDILFFDTFDAVFNAVEKGMCRYGVLPIENSLAGSVTQVYDLMEKHHFHIVRAIRQRIDHALMARRGTRLEDVKEVYSHPQALAQCRDFLVAHPNMRVIECENTAVAARKVAESGRTDIAAIASRRCGELYDLSTVCSNVAGGENNYTRFICIGRELEIFPDADKVSMTLSLPHEPGSLHMLLSRFAALDMNLTKLESRPAPGSEFEFRFHFDVEASTRNEETIRLLCELDESCERFVFLGNYMES